MRASLIAFLVCLAAHGIVVIAAAADGPATAQTKMKRESFDRDPKWDGRNNRQSPANPPVVRQNFGFSDTHHAGKARGEIGGEMWQGSRPAYYGKVIEAKSFEDALSASGTVTLLHGQSISGWHTTCSVYVGWFNADAGDLIWRPLNFVGFRMQTSNEPDGCIVEMTYGTSQYQAGGLWVNAAGGGQDKNPSELQSSNLLTIKPDRAKHEWAIAYDPKADNGRGEIIFTFDGNESRLSIRAHRKVGAKFNRFGIFTPRVPGLKVVTYFDDITIDGKSEDFSKDPGWEGVGNRERYEDPVQYAYNDFGYSAKTNHAGGKAGELGGRFFSCNPSENEFKAHYGDRVGKLSLNDRLLARGKFAAKDYAIDSTFALGWFNAAEQGWPIKDFVGVYFDSLSDAGRLVQPMYGTSAGTADRSGKWLPWTPDGTRYDWALEYDPHGADGRGAITYTPTVAAQSRLR
jgi:hypothetical protein